MSNFYFCLPCNWLLESFIPVILYMNPPPFWNITVLWSNTTQIVITHICIIFSKRTMSLSICSMAVFTINFLTYQPGCANGIFTSPPYQGNFEFICSFNRHAVDFMISALVATWLSSADARLFNFFVGDRPLNIAQKAHGWDLLSHTCCLPWLDTFIILLYPHWRVLKNGDPHYLVLQASSITKFYLMVYYF